MNKYLAVLRDRSGRWTSGSLTTQAYVFEADDDKAAVMVMASYLNGGGSGYAIEFLGRITGGLQVQKVRVPDNVRDSDVTELSHGRQQEIGFGHLFIGESMISQLQPFDLEVKKDRLAAIKKHKKRDKSDRAKVSAIPLPKAGDDIYIPSAFYLSRGRDDVVGGLAKVKSVYKQMSGGEQVHFVSVKEIPGVFNWEKHLALMQAELKEKFGKSRAHPYPDARPEFNEP